MRIPEADLQAFLNEVERNFPNFKIIYKDEELPRVWYILAIFKLVRMWGFFAPKFEKAWMERFSNGIGDYILLPTQTNHYGDLRDIRTYTILRHEYVHMIDQKRWSIWFFLTYILLPLPLLISGRSYWELRGYAQNIIVRHEYGLETTDAHLSNIARFFIGSMYFFMFPFRSVVMKRLERLREDVVSGKVRGYLPAV